MGYTKWKPFYTNLAVAGRFSREMRWDGFLSIRQRDTIHASIPANQRAGIYNLRVMMCDDAKKQRWLPEARNSTFFKCVLWGGGDVLLDSKGGGKCAQLLISVPKTALGKTTT